MVIDGTTAYHHTTTGPAIRSAPSLIRALFRMWFSWFQLFSVDALQNQIYGNERLEAQHFKDRLRYGEDVDEVVKCHFVRYLSERGGVERLIAVYDREGGLPNGQRGRMAHHQPGGCGSHALCSNLLPFIGSTWRARLEHIP